MRNNKFALLLILFINKHLYGMELPEEKLIEGISCVLKMMHSTDDVSEREKEIIKDVFLREFRDHEVFSIVQEYSPDDIFDLLIDKSNSNLPGILRDKLVTRCHDLYHRKEINLTPSLGIVKVFIRSKSSNKLAKLPVSIGQGAVIGPQCILTAKHVLHSVEGYKGKNDLSELLDSNCLPDDYKAGEEWDSVSFFFLPQIDDPTKDKFYEISGYSAVNQSGEIDVACAHTSEKINCPIINTTGDLRTHSPIEVRYIEYIDKYRMYTVDNLILGEDCYPELKRRYQCHLLPKFMKAGMSGSGIIYNEDNSVCGVFNGIVAYKKDDSYINVFKFTPLQAIQKWIEEQKQIDITNDK